MASAISPGTAAAGEGTGDRWVVADTPWNVDGIDGIGALREGVAAQVHAPTACRQASPMNVVRAIAANIGSERRNVNGDSFRGVELTAPDATDPFTRAEAGGTASGAARTGCIPLWQLRAPTIE